MIISTQSIFSFPGKSLIKALISASRGSNNIKKITKSVRSNPPPNRNRKVIAVYF